MTELEKAQARIAELAEMLNNSHQAALTQVEDERDACGRAIQFLLDMAQGSQPPDLNRIEAFKQALEAIEARKNPQVKMISEMAHGTMIGEYVHACVQRAVDMVHKSYEPVLKAALDVADREGNEALKAALAAREGEPEG